MLIAIVKETEPDERRVAITPPTLARLLKLGVSVAIETGAGLAAGFADAAYQGASIAASAADAVREADIVMTVRPPTPALVSAMKPARSCWASSRHRATRISCPPCGTPGSRHWRWKRCPDQSRAGDGCPVKPGRIGRLLRHPAGRGPSAPYPAMMTTAVGSLRAAQVLVMGLGVAGLQALATAHRLGAVTSGYDVRPETAEQARSLGAKFVDTGVDAGAKAAMPAL